MKLLIVADLHGRRPLIPKVDFDVIIVPGDVCSDGLSAYMLAPVTDALRGRPIRNWYDIAGKRRALAGLRKSVRDGRAVLERLNALGKPVYVVPGNWDWTGGPSEWAPETKNHWRALTKGLRRVRDIDHKRVALGEVDLIGYGRCNGPELYRYRGYKNVPKALRQSNEKRYRQTLGALSKLFRKRPSILLCHNVPYGTPLDLIRNKKSAADGKHYGSVIARDLIRTHRPALAIGGHIHEGRGVCRIGRTVCVNAGFGSGVATIVEMENGRVRSLTLHDKHRRTPKRIKF